ncbi:fumarylacetoacetate hydrolase family protein [Sphingopyxis sp.]|uniref:fumarylacetoacetate hydrolase family protein n=1 Tax=Sphingopyxis sp. TaxID=1908224 RepID=UPI0026033152|nr:fumarylacetoacetate hydrolase family protein [Sphingopyxis sp.]MCW0198054.1 fumarylacetoacetate hydrolase family protein [Sphingopyxis sp.]
MAGASLDRRAALAALGAGLAFGCAAPGFARHFEKEDRRMTRFALATRATPEGARPTIRVGDAFHDLHAAADAHGFAAVAGDVSAIIRDWDARREGLFALARALDGTAGGIEAPALAAPFEPRRIFAAASNFIEHADEMKTKLAAKAESEPYIFLKTVESVVGPNETVVVPPQVSRPDWEVELGVVLGRAGKHVAAADAHDLIAGYTIVNDVSARDRTRRSDFPFSHDWFRGKSFDSFTPLGPVFVPRDCLGDPHDIRLGLKVNGEAMQDGNTSEMIFNIYEQIAYLSTILELRAGDLIASGTPAGVGMGRGVFLKDGDVMDAWVEGIGELRNPVSAPHLPRA